MAIGSTFAKNRETRNAIAGPSTQRERDRIEAGRQFMAEDKLFTDFPSRTAYDQALYERTQGIAAGRSEAAQAAQASPVNNALTESPNLRFPMTQGGQLGISQESISEKAEAEKMRLGGLQPFGITAQPTSFESAGVKKESGGVIQTPYGIMSTSAPVGQKEFEGRMAQVGPDRSESYAMTPFGGGFERQFSGADDRQVALARASEGGLLIGQRLQEQGRNRYYAFREESERGRAQEALSTERGRSPDKARGAQALIQAERFRQAQQGRSPMSRSPLVFGASAPQPAASFSASPSMGGPSTMGGGGSPFSFTPFSQRMENQTNSSLMGFSSEVGKPLNVPKSKILRPDRLPFGMRPFGG
jgi:hypothetical protein